MNLRQSIKLACARKDINCRMLADLSGVRQATISTLMNDKSKGNVVTIQRLSEALDLKVSEFIKLGE